MVQDLLPNDAHHVKALLAADAINNHVAVDADEVLAVEDGVLVLVQSVILFQVNVTSRTCPAVSMISVA